MEDFKGEIKVERKAEGERLDIFMSNLFADFTRSHIKNLIERGEILLNGKIVKAGYILKEGQVIQYEIEKPKSISLEPQDIDFEIVYQDSDLLVINKPQGLVVHPCASTKDNTLVNALIYRIKDLSGINGQLRPGIVHRLDKNTSGLMLVAKNDFAHVALAKQIKDKTCSRKYLALCEGVFTKDSDTITTYIERSKNDRKKMAVSNKGKIAISEYRVVERFTNATLVEFSLKTGRTHQIRVHCKMLGHSIIGDSEYGKADKNLKGQLLHSYYISFIHPRSNKRMEFEIALPQYFKNYMQKLKKID